MAADVGACVLDFAFLEPTLPPVTTTAWRLGQLIVGKRKAVHHMAEIALLRNLYANNIAQQSRATGGQSSAPSSDNFNQN